MGNMSFQPIIITVGGLVIIFAVVGIIYFCFTKFNSKKILKKLESMSGNLIVAEDGDEVENNSVENKNIDVSNDTDGVNMVDTVKSENVSINDNTNETNVDVSNKDGNNVL